MHYHLPRVIRLQVCLLKLCKVDGLILDVFNYGFQVPGLLNVRLFCGLFYYAPITVAARSKASNTRIVDSNPTRGMDVCVHLFCVCVVLCVGSGLATG
jgi:hypothetical protein